MFADRVDAGRRLGARVRELLGPSPDRLVLGLPRGGVPVAAEVARELGASLDVLVVRKLGAPSQPEVAIGAIGPHGVALLHPSGRRMDPEVVDRIRRRELAELERRERSYRGDRGPLAVEGRRVVIVDDGIATGATALVAVQAARALGAAEVVVAAPVAAPEARDAVAAAADQVIVLAAPARFWAVGEWYTDFRQTDDAEVIRLLGR
jgi:putative phosphoribosyl transferase